MLFLEYQMRVLTAEHYGWPAPMVPPGFTVPGGVTVTRDPSAAPARPVVWGRKQRCVVKGLTRRGKVGDGWIGN